MQTPSSVLQTQLSDQLPNRLPSFSIILETENLINADLDGLSLSLASLMGQTVSLSQAEEVLIIDSGDVPAELIAQLQQRHPWLTVHRTVEPMEYYEAKMLGAELAKGEVIVYCDSDCVYEPQWLQNLLTPFVEQPENNPQVNLVAGETTTSGLGPYGTAMALGYIFPQYSGQTSLQPAHQYFLNNVAFRRQFLLSHPIPTQLPLYRGNCHIHAHQLMKAGEQLWRQPQARSLHAPPNGLSHFFWRFLLIGYDAYWQKRVQAQLQLPGSARGYRDPISGKSTKVGVFGVRLKGLLARDSRHLWMFPLALPVLLSSSLLILVGNLITRWQSNFLLAAYSKVLVAQGQQPITLYPQPSASPVNATAKGTQQPYAQAKQIS